MTGRWFAGWLVAVILGFNLTTAGQTTAGLGIVTLACGLLWFRAKS